MVYRIDRNQSPRCAVALCGGGARLGSLRILTQSLDDPTPPPVRVDGCWLSATLAELPSMSTAKMIVSCARLYSQGMELIEDRPDVAYRYSSPPRKRWPAKRSRITRQPTMRRSQSRYPSMTVLLSSGSLRRMHASWPCSLQRAILDREKIPALSTAVHRPAAMAKG
jgi:hypothetical protein